MFGNRSHPDVRRVEKELVVLNRGGLHPGPARGFVLRAVQYKSRVWLKVGEDLYRGERVMDLLAAHLGEGRQFTLIVEGPDAEKVVGVLSEYLESLAHEGDQAPVAGASAFDF